MELKASMFPIKPSPHDDRDYTLPLSLDGGVGDFINGEEVILNQETTDQCAYFSQAALLQAVTGEQLSPSFGYGNREDDDYMGPGEYAREALKDVYKAGLCLATEMPLYQTTEECVAAFRALPQDVKDRAKENRLEGYYRLSRVPDSFLEVMHKTGLKALLSIPLYKNSWTEAMTTGIVMPPRDGDVSLGGHMIQCSGQKGNYIRLPNSWGSDIPTNGVQLLHKDYPINEVWLPIPYIKTTIKMYNGKKEYSVNGETRVMDTSPAIVSGRMMVPLRFMANAMMGTFVDWSQKNRAAYIYRGGDKLVFKEGANSFFSIYSIDYVPYDAGVTNMINKDGRMLIPVRRVMEFFGWNVNYDKATRMITITNY